MAVPLFVHIFTFSSILVDILIIYGIFRLREQASIRMNWYLIISISTVIVWIIAVYLQETIFPFFPDKILINIIPFSILAFISNLAVGIGLLFLSIFFNYLISPTLGFKRTMILVSLISVITVLYIIVMIAAFQGSVPIFDIAFAFANVNNLLLLIAILYFINGDIRKLKQNIPSSSKKLRKQLNYLHLGLVTVLVGLIPLVLISNFIFRNAISFTFILITFTLSFIAYGYQIDPRVVYVLPERMYMAIVVSSHGVLRYHVTFYGEEDDAGTVLISGALKAVTALMGEFYKSPVNPTMIEFENQLILIKWEENYFLAVFADRDTKLIREAMNASVREINSKYQDNMQEVMDGPRMLDLDKEFSNTFYFAYAM